MSLYQQWHMMWCVKCETCGDHVHINVKRDEDPRLDTRLKGWRLDVDGEDYCPACSSRQDVLLMLEHLRGESR